MPRDHARNLRVDDELRDSLDEGHEINVLPLDSGVWRRCPGHEMTMINHTNLITAVCQRVVP